jgi:hypothetical protein
MTEGSATRRLLGLLGVAIGAVLPPLAGMAQPAHCPECRVVPREEFCCSDGWPFVLTEWSPTVDPRRPGEGATCLPPGERGEVRIFDYARKPPDYDPAAPPNPLHACLLVGLDGRVQAVRLSPSLGVSRDRNLQETIATWTFAASHGKSDWVRVRLNSRYAGLAGVP